ncbi:MAG: sigma-70 family RNA polymerase sigma factor [Patescibacteria group bacterium]
MVTDEQLVADYLSGRAEAFDELVRRYLRPLFNYSLSLAGDKGQAEDAVQETFLKAWRQLRRFDQQRSFRTWIYRVARNATFDLLKKRRTVSFAEFESEDGGNVLIETTEDPEPWPDELFDRALDARLLREALGRLPLPFQEVIDLHHRGELTFREIAEILAEPLDTVKSRYQRGLLRLKKLLADQNQ